MKFEAGEQKFKLDENYQQAPLPEKSPKGKESDFFLTNTQDYLEKF